MKATVIKVVSKPSNYGGNFYYIFFKSLDEADFGRSYRTCVGSHYRNFDRWRGVKPGMVLDYLNLIKRGNSWMVDADSQFGVESEAKHLPNTYMVR